MASHPPLSSSCWIRLLSTPWMTKAMSTSTLTLRAAHTLLTIYTMAVRMCPSSVTKLPLIRISPTGFQMSTTSSIWGSSIINAREWIMLNIPLCSRKNGQAFLPMLAQQVTMCLPLTATFPALLLPSPLRPFSTPRVPISWLWWWCSGPMSSPVNPERYVYVLI